LSQLNNSKNAPQSYIKKWMIFSKWLDDYYLNIQIKSMVKFGEQFYESIYQFLTGKDSIPRILNNDCIITLPPGNRAHEMPDKVEEWITELENAEELLFNIFPDILFDAENNLSDEKFDVFCESLANGIKKACGSFKKWLECWTHLPLSICCLGSNNGSIFARAFLLVFYNLQISLTPSPMEISYIESLKQDLQQENLNTFGLKEALQDPDFFREFRRFATENTTEFWKFPQLYDFVKNRVWNIIVHQQQLEGMFNRYDMKTNPNMNVELQQARVKLSGPRGNNIVVTDENLKETRKVMQTRSSNINIDDIELELSNEDKAKAILRNYLVVKKSKNKEN
jgi:hypothetical protein